MGYSLQIILVFVYLMQCSLTVQNIFILPLFKEKGAKACDRDSYCGIAMFSVFFKVFEMILLRQLEKIAEEKVISPSYSLDLGKESTV